MLAREPHALPPVGTTAFAGGALVLLGALGDGYSVPTLLPAVGVSLVLLVASLVRRRPRRILLIDLWTAAFAYLFLADSLFSTERVLQIFGAETTRAAEGFLVGAFGASLLGYSLAHRLVRLPVAARRAAADPRRRGMRKPLPMSVSLVLGVVSALAVVYVVFIITPAELLDAGRAERTQELGALRALLNAGLTMQPVLIAYAVARYATSSAQRTVLLGSAILALLALYASGTRFFLGFALSGCLFYVVRPLEPMSRRKAVLAATALVVVLALQGTMRLSRGAGLSSVELESIVSGLLDPATYLSSENMLAVNAWVHDKRAFDVPGRPLENAYILYWWVPRALWPDKPTMEGHWLLYEVMDESGFSESHSVSGGFAMPALVDFGPRLGVAFSALYGALIFLAEVFAWRHRQPSDAKSILTALLPFGVFFMMRSMHTGLIFLCLCLLWALPLLRLESTAVGRERERARPRATAGQRLALAR